jgi:A/G-specific adenine glycosylase
VIKNTNIPEARIVRFRRNLLQWHDQSNDRSYPWKQEQDPYKIWLSEIILQQTRSEQGLPYYIKFIDHYPTIVDLANAHDEAVFKLWQGLGYYNRCKNLLYTARYVRDYYKGVFPTRYDDILALKGIGAYTAAAIASFAYQLPYAVLDGNVFRVLARIEDVVTPIDTSEGKKMFAELAQKFLDIDAPHLYNQAIMDLGATVCMPKQPVCLHCPVKEICKSYKNGTQTYLPYKSKKIQIKTRHFNFIILKYRDTIYIEKRKDGDIWSNLYQPYLIEGEKTAEELSRILRGKLGNIKKLKSLNFQIHQKLTHQRINSHFYELDIDEVKAPLNSKDFMTHEELKKIAFPKTIISFFDNKYYF